MKSALYGSPFPPRAIVPSSLLQDWHPKHHHEAGFWRHRHFPYCGWSAICHRIVVGEFLGKTENFLIVVNQAGAWAGSAGDGGRRRQQQRGADTEHSAADLHVLVPPPGCSTAPCGTSGWHRDENSSWSHSHVFPGEASCLHKHSAGISQPHQLDTGLLCLTSCCADIHDTSSWEDHLRATQAGISTHEVSAREISVWFLIPP